MKPLGINANKAQLISRTFEKIHTYIYWQISFLGLSELAMSVGPTLLGILLLHNSKHKLLV